eukprot:COSAG06_NODE_9741_length_1829_cov_1.134104_2_plen_138_part_00
MAFAASKLQSFSDADLEDADLLAELAELQDEVDQPAGVLQGVLHHSPPPVSSDHPVPLVADDELKKLQGAMGGVVTEAPAAPTLPDAYAQVSSPPHPGPVPWPAPLSALRVSLCCLAVAAVSMRCRLAPLTLTRRPR